MSENTPDEDFDLDDFDDELADESWDEFDESPTESEAAPKEKSFVQKNFNLIVISIVVIGASIFALGQFMKAGNDKVTTSQTSTLPSAEKNSVQQFDITESDPMPEDEIVELTENSGLPPMPAPMETSTNEHSDNAQFSGDIFLDLEDTDKTIAELEISEDSALTPLPGDFSANTPKLVELEIEELTTTAVNDDALLAAEQPGVNIMKDLNPQKEDTALPMIEEDGGEILPDFFDETSNNPKISKNKEKELNIEVKENLPVDTNQPTALEEKLMINNNNLINKVTEKDEKIENLNNDIKVLKEKIAQLEIAQTVKPPTQPNIKSKKPTAPPPKTISRTTAKPTPKSTKKEATPSKTRDKSAHTWVMRSAQPGQALVFDKKSGDMRPVEVGHDLSGIGRILSISIENNKWVIRGSHGTITQ